MSDGATRAAIETGIDGVTIRDMRHGDLEETLALIARWGEHDAFYQLVFAVPTWAPLVAVSREGRIVGTGVAIVNGPTEGSGGVPTGWIGTIFVAPEMRRRGIGEAITAAVADRLVSLGCRTTALIASPMGRPVYAKMGFEVECDYVVFGAEPLAERPAPPPGARLRPIEPADHEAVFALDRRATNEDRSAILTQLAPRGWLVEDDAALRGFFVPTEGGAGACIAERPEDALCLLDVHRSMTAPGKRAHATVVDANVAGRQALIARGWSELFTTPRMLRGPAWPWQPELVWGLLGFAFG